MEMITDTVKHIENAKEKIKPTHYRFVMLFLITFILTISTADRATLSVAGVSMSKDLGFSALDMGYLFSAFSWAYVCMQVPSGWLGDKFGAKITIFTGLAVWSVVTLLMGSVHMFAYAFALMLILRFLLGIFESPVGPSCGKVLAAWFPSTERGVAGSIYNAAQYFSLALFTPLMGWLTYRFSWHFVYIVMGCIGIIAAFMWYKLFYVPRKHPKANTAEINLIEQGGGLVDMDMNLGKTEKKKRTASWSDIKQIFSSRMLVGIFIAQYCICAITWFYLSWFPIYLVKARGLSILHAGFIASIPAIAGCIGGGSAGFVSDWILRKTGSLSFARKIPITIGFSLAASMVICNYVDSTTAVIFVMSMAFFGKGFGNLGWTVVADTAPKKIVGITGGIFNSMGQASGIITPVVIGWILQATGSFNGALAYISVHGIIVILAYWIIVGKIQRFTLKEERVKEI